MLRTKMDECIDLTRAWKLSNGATVCEGGVHFRVWAPKCHSLQVEVIGKLKLPMIPSGGYFEAETSQVVPGDDYFYCLDSGKKRPDPVSRFQFHGVHGPSRVIDPHYRWHDEAWKGIELSQLVLYELHVGTFSPQGTFAGVIDRLKHLKELGITAISLMPVAQFPGNRNWGYDGVYPYAVQRSYGGPEGLKQLVDACHQQGLAVIMDVVYNHLGPEGNYLAEYGPYFNDHYKTPWGWAINYDGADSDGVRQYVIDNALYWLTEYHCDGLRLDAVHALYDFGASHILRAIREAVADQAKRLNLPKWVIAESDLNDVRILKPPEVGGYGIDAQWNDDFHHAVHAALTGRDWSYLVDFGSLAHVRRAIEEGYVMDGRYSRYRKRCYGSSTRELSGEKLITFIQNHDQIANACQGKRFNVLLSLEAQKLAAALSICSPSLPMLFMGEEWGATTPFYYFTSFEAPGLIQNVSKGRLQEWGEQAMDPQDKKTFFCSRLNWDELKRAEHQAVFAYYRDLLTWRREHPALIDRRKDLLHVRVDEQAHWLELNRKGELLLICNFYADQQEIDIEFPNGLWKPILCSFDKKYGGKGKSFHEELKGGVLQRLTFPKWGAVLFIRHAESIRSSPS